MLGAAMSLAHSGGLKGELANRLKDDKERDKALDELSRLRPSEFIDKMKAEKVDPHLAAQALGDKETNLKKVAEFGIQDKVRRMQGEDANALLRSHLASGLMTGMGGDPRSRQMEAPRLAEMLRGEMAKMDPALLSDPAKAEERNTHLAKFLQPHFQGGDAKAAVAAAVGGTEAAIARDPNLKKYGSIAGFIAAHDSKRLDATEARYNQMQEERARATTVEGKTTSGGAGTNTLPPRDDDATETRPTKSTVGPGGTPAKPVETPAPAKPVETPAPAKADVAPAGQPWVAPEATKLNGQNGANGAPGERSGPDGPGVPGGPGATGRAAPSGGNDNGNPGNIQLSGTVKLDIHNNTMSFEGATGVPTH
jgi:hypothetical protein